MVRIAERAFLGAKMNRKDFLKLSGTLIAALALPPLSLSSLKIPARKVHWVIGKDTLPVKI